LQNNWILLIIFTNTLNSLEVCVDLIGVETTICSGELQELTATTIAAYAL
jgi:hypothetical protein